MKFPTYGAIVVRCLFACLLLSGFLAIGGSFFPVETTPAGNRLSQSPVAEKNAEPDRSQNPSGSNELVGRSASGERSFDDLLKEARETGFARVIAGLRVRFEPEGRLANRAAVQTQRTSIARSQAAMLNRLSAHRVAAVKRFAFIPFIAMEIDAAGLERLRSLPEVASIEEDAMQRISLAESVPLVGAPAAWASGYTGAGQTVAILDTGVDKTHSFLANKVVSEACYSTTNTQTTSVCPGGVAQSTANDSGLNCAANISGCQHGTHVAGIAAGKGATFSGVAPDAKIIAIQVASKLRTCPSASVPCVVIFTSDTLLGLQRVQELSASISIAAVNMSLGGRSSSINCDSAESAYKAAIDNLRSAGVATVAAAGNESNHTGISRPACVSSAISVGSTGDGSNGSTFNAVSGFSNSETILNLLAPGEWINSSVPGGGFSNLRGTSMATPHVTGAWAVMKSKSPQASVSQAHQALADTGLPILDPRNGVTKPRIRVDAAVNALSSTPCNFALAPAAQGFTRAGGAGAVNLTTPGSCAWTARSNVSWISITSGASGAGNGAAGFSVAPNAGFERTGTMVIGGQTYFVTQEGAPALAVDDGTFENAVGLSLGGKVCAVNRLTPSRYPASIDTVGVHFQSFPGVPIDREITVLYGLNPAGATEIGSLSFKTVPGRVKALDQFNLYSIPPQVANTGDFVVGFCVEHAASELPVALDQSPTSRRRSFISLNDGAYQLVDAFSTSLAGNFGIRALQSSRHVVATSAAIVAESCAASNNAVDPGETVTINFTLRNVGTEAIGNLVATLEPGGGVSAPSGPQTFGVMASGGNPATRSFSFTANGSCGNAVTAVLRLQDGVADLGVVPVSFPLGAPAPFTVANNYSYSGPPVAIPDNGTVEVSLAIADPGLAGNLKVRLRLDHTFDADLDVFLVGPDGTAVELTTDNGGAGDNYGSGTNDCSGNFTAFDDAAPGSVKTATAPFIGTFKPEGLLSDFKDKPVAGVWKLRIADDTPGASGTLGCWQLEIARQQTFCCGSTCPSIAFVNPETVEIGSQITLAGRNLNGVTAVKFAGNVTANFAVVSPAQLRITVPPGARPGALTISGAAGCPDFQIFLDVLTLEFSPGGLPALVNEECAPANNTVDPGERVTLNFPVRNTGTGNATNLVATLLSSGGVIAPSAPQSYGPVAGGGTAVIRPFTFTAGASCGGAITATFQLQDGAINLGTMSFTLTVGQRFIFIESFDRVSAPSLPAGWNTITVTGSASPWTTSTATSDSPPNCAFAPNPSATSDIRLETPGIAVSSPQSVLSFRNNYILEAGSSVAFDGGVLEIAIGTDPFTDIVAAGGSFIAGAYNRTLTTSSTQPLAGRAAWSGNSGGYINTSVRLPASAAGKSVKLRWRLGSDFSVGAPGWRIDGVTISEIVCAQNCGPVCHSIAGINPSSGLAGSTVTITGLELTGATSVRFAGNAAAQFTVNSATQITATVPSGAATGPITVSKPGCPDATTPVFTVNFAGYEADVAPRPNGSNNGTLTVSDWVQVGRFVAGLDLAAIGGEFQRADCAPISTLGDGRLTPADWVQAGRYTSAEDPAVAAGGPAGPIPASTASSQKFAARTAKPDEPRTVRIVAGDAARGRSGSATIELEAQGDENALGFSLLFDPKEWRLVSAEAGRDARRAVVHVNDRAARDGRVGFVMALPSGLSFSPGLRRMLVLNFAPALGGHSQPLVLDAADEPVAREIVNREAAALPARYEIVSADQSFGALAHVSAASLLPGPLAAGQIAAVFGENLSAASDSAASATLPLELAGARAAVTDSRGIERFARLIFVSPGQINYLIPDETAEGIATVRITNSAGQVSIGLIEVTSTAPGLFTANADGTGVAAAIALRVGGDGTRSYEPVTQLDAALNRFVPLPVDLRSGFEERDGQIHLILFGTGIRNRSELSAVTCSINGVEMPVAFAGAQGGFAGLDQINVGPLPRSLAGRGIVELMLVVDGKPANVVELQIR